MTKPSAQLDAIQADAVYPKAALCRKAGWGKHTLRKARLDGLGPWIRYGRSVYIRGSDVLAFFDKLAAEQAIGVAAGQQSDPNEDPQVRVLAENPGDGMS